MQIKHPMYDKKVTKIYTSAPFITIKTIHFGVVHTHIAHIRNYPPVVKVMPFPL